MHKPIIQGSITWQELIDQGYVVISRDDFDALTKWRPIETAPKDRWILLSKSEEQHPALVAKWAATLDEDHFFWCKLDGVYMTVRASEVDHWMPLPEPPQ